MAVATTVPKRWHRPISWLRFGLHLVFLGCGADCASTAAYTTHVPEMFMVACSKVTRSEASVVEWIEFHRIQGVDKFVFYVEAPPGDREASLSLNQVALLNEFYGQAGLPGLVEVIPAGPLVLETVTVGANIGHSYSDYHRTAQNAAFKDCLARYGHRAEWIILLDDDEYAFTAEPGTMKQYLHAIGHRHYQLHVPGAAPYPLSGMSGLPTEPSRQQLKMFHELYTQNATEWMEYLKNETLDGIYLPSVPYGSAGQFWETTSFLQRDPVSGKINLYFDPRDNFRFNHTYGQIARGLRRRLAELPTDPAQLSKLAPEVAAVADAFNSEAWTRSDWDKEVIGRLKWLSNDLFEDLLNRSNSEVLDYFVERLARDYHEDDHVPIFPPINSVYQAQLRHRISDLLTINQQSQADPLEAKNDRFDELYELFSDIWAEFYPLLTEEAVWRMPMYLTGDGMDSLFDAIITAYPECKKWVEESREMEHAYAGPDHIAPPVPTWVPPDKMCTTNRDGPQYLDQTLLGKTMYWTGEWIRRDARKGLLNGHVPPASLEEALTRAYDFAGCTSPWIHFCGFRASEISFGTVSRSNPIYEFRIDHHSARSFFKRSLGFPAWRKKHILGYAAARGPKTGSWERFINSFKDDRKRRFVGPLRESISKLRPLPKFPRYELLHDHRAVQHYGLMTDCTPAEVLSESRVMCPREYPYVGLNMPQAIAPPSPLIVGGWCLNQEGLTPQLQRSLVDMVARRKEQIVLCPGWPETSCCNWLGDYLPYNSTYSVRDLNVSHWLGASVCAGCDWQHHVVASHL